MSLQDVIQKLNGVKKSQSGFIAKCPAHNDDKQSLSINDSSERVLLNCFAGCPPEAIVRAIGIDWKQLFHNSNNYSKKSWSRDGISYAGSNIPKITAVYR
jgi:hypothetical protein